MCARALVCPAFVVSGAHRDGCNFHNRASRTNRPGRVICYDSPKFMRKPWVIAHRGASGHTPENTLAAFERAVQLGAGFIETDLHLTRDARFVAIHDATLERTSNGRG